MIKILQTLFLLLVSSAVLLYELIDGDETFFPQSVAFVSSIMIYQIWKVKISASHRTVRPIEEKDMSLKDAVKANEKEQLNQLQKVSTFSENHSVHEVTFSTGGIPSPDTGYEATITLSSKQLDEMIDFVFSMKGSKDV